MGHRTLLSFFGWRNDRSSKPEEGSAETPPCWSIQTPYKLSQNIPWTPQVLHSVCHVWVHVKILSHHKSLWICWPYMPFWLLDAGCYLRLAERPTPRSLCRAGRSFRSRPAARVTSESCTRSWSSCLGRHRDTALALARDKHPNTGDDEQKHRETLVDLRTSTIYNHIYIYIHATHYYYSCFFRVARRTQAQR